MTKRFVYSFSEGNKDLKELLGGKGANLTEMMRIGIPVPPGFTITTEACREYLAHVISVKDEQEAIRIANSVDFGLTASIHTQDLSKALRIAGELETGMVKVNAPTAGVDFYAPFGGIKDSSYGMREQGKVALDFYTFTRTISINETKKEI